MKRGRHAAGGRARNVQMAARRAATEQPQLRGSRLALTLDALSDTDIACGALDRLQGKAAAACRFSPSVANKTKRDRVRQPRHRARVRHDAQAQTPQTGQGPTRKVLLCALPRLTTIVASFVFSEEGCRKCARKRATVSVGCAPALGKWHFSPTVVHDVYKSSYTRAKRVDRKHTPSTQRQHTLATRLTQQRDRTSERARTQPPRADQPGASPLVQPQQTTLGALTHTQSQNSGVQASMTTPGVAR